MTDDSLALNLKFYLLTTQFFVFHDSLLYLFFIIIRFFREDLKSFMVTNGKYHCQKER